MFKNFLDSAFARVTRYTVVRLFTLFITVTIGVYLTIMIANMGGYVDTIMRAEIRDRVTQMVINKKENRNLDPEVRKKIADELIAAEEKRLSLDVPVAIRSFNYLTNALQLNLGRALNMTSDNGSRTVRLILLERLPATLLLMGTSELFLFFASVYAALTLSAADTAKLEAGSNKLEVAVVPLTVAVPTFTSIEFVTAP